jgi:anti-anti-sigma factor
MSRTKRHHHLATLKITLEHLPPATCRIELAGEMDNLNFQPLMTFILDNLMKEETAAVIDLQRVGFMDSSGIKVILMLGDRLGYNNLALCCVNPHIHRMLTIAGLEDKMWHITRPCPKGEWEASLEPHQRRRVA